MEPVFRRILGLLGVVLVIAACAPQDTASVVELDQSPTTEAAPVVIYVTPTTEPSAIPTVELASPGPTATPTQAPTSTPDEGAIQAQCQRQMEALYIQASEACLGGPAGFVCNGGLPPGALPAGPISNALAVVGSLIEVELVEMVHSAPLPSNNSGGIVWLRLSEPLAVNALLVGDVRVENVTPADGNFETWQAVQVTTRQQTSECATAPSSAFLAQGPYGGIGRLVINGVSVEINGTIAVETRGTTTEFIALEGRTRLVVFGEGRIMYAGEQITVDYSQDDFSRPLAVPEEAYPLTFDHIRHFPVTLLDRPVLLPQPGAVFTEGQVNMRAEPRVSSQLLFQVPDNQPLSILGQNPEGTWYHVRLGNGETGWMRNDLVTGTVGVIETIYEPTPVPPQRYGLAASRAVVVVPDGGNLRRAPDVQFDILATLPEGTEVELLARSPYSAWVKVDTGSLIGWMALITLDTQAVIAFLPVDYDVPLPPGPTATPFFTFGGGHAYPDPRSGQ